MTSPEWTKLSIAQSIGAKNVEELAPIVSVIIDDIIGIRQSGDKECRGKNITIAGGKEQIQRKETFVEFMTGIAKGIQYIYGKWKVAPGDYEFGPPESKDMQYNPSSDKIVVSVDLLKFYERGSSELYDTVHASNLTVKELPIILAAEETIRAYQEKGADLPYASPPLSPIGALDMIFAEMSNNDNILSREWDAKKDQAKRIINEHVLPDLGIGSQYRGKGKK